MSHVNLLNVIKNAILEVKTLQEAIDITNNVYGNKECGIPKTISTAYPCFMWEIVKINPIVYCTECGNELSPGKKCLNEYYLYSGRKPVNNYCTDCAETVLRKYSKLAEELKIIKKPFTNM